MRRRSNSPATPATPVNQERVGLWRHEPLGTERAGTLNQLFSNLHRVTRGESIGEHPERHLQGIRVRVDNSQGHGYWEMYRLDQELYLNTADGVYDSPHTETLPGEGMFEIHLRLAGTLELELPRRPSPLTVTGPSLLLMYQPPGVSVSQRVTPSLRDACVTLYCRPQFIAELARRNGIEKWPLLEEIASQSPTAVWHRLSALSPALQYLGKSLLESSFQRGVRLLYAEAKSLELLCEILALSDTHDGESPGLTDTESRQLYQARRLIGARLSEPMRICDIARNIGMSESKLKRAFKARFGTTVHDYGLECRMRHALDLLRCKRLSVNRVAQAVGYRHHTSFTHAFVDCFGFLPSKARHDAH